MLIDTLDKFAESYVPDGVHELLHVHSRTAWIETVMYILEQGNIKPTKQNIKLLAESWENILFKRYSTLN